MGQKKNDNQILVNIDLNTIKEDKVTVTVTPPKFKTNEIIYNIPKTVPGTYSEDNYGRFIDNLIAVDSKGNTIEVSKIDKNSWKIVNAKKIARISYQVNDTYDTENGYGYGSTDVFSPAGSNIEDGKNFMLNTHCFIGYFDGYVTIPYKVIIEHSEKIWGATSMTDIDNSTTSDIFETANYANLVENPIMYSKPDYTTFNINGMEILIAVYSPSGLHSAESFTPAMKKMINAQKTFLGTINSTTKYSVLIYLSDVYTKDAKGFGALEHPTATTVVMPELMSKEELEEQLKDVVSHEFFHILTPLTIHSKEIQYFDFINPKMSKHLWLYEGVTEYFANLFQVNQGLITEDDFYERMSEKISEAATFNDTLAFTLMSENVLVKPYKDQYLNVYQKGTLIGMCIDIIIREKSNGKIGILDLMKKLSNEYGVNKPFNDDELFAKITELTYPEVGQFLATYVSGSTPIPYDDYFEKVGVTKTKIKVSGNVFVNNNVSYITVNPTNKEIIVQSNAQTNPFFKELGIKDNDIILAIDSTNYNSDNVYELIIASQNWREDEAISVKIKRNNREEIIKGKIKLPFEELEGYKATDLSKNTLREDWLKG